MQSAALPHPDPLKDEVPVTRCAGQDALQDACRHQSRRAGRKPERAEERRLLGRDDRGRSLPLWACQADCAKLGRITNACFRPIAVILVPTHSANMIAETIAVFALLATSSPEASDGACPRVASRIEADRLYVDRSILIIKVAANGDVTAFNGLVASDAHLEFWRGDYTSSARSKGPPGFMLGNTLLSRGLINRIVQKQAILYLQPADSGTQPGMSFPNIEVDRLVHSGSLATRLFEAFRLARQFD